MRLIIMLLLGYLLFQPVLAAVVPTKAQFQQELKLAKSNKNTPRIRRKLLRRCIVP